MGNGKTVVERTRHNLFHKTLCMWIMWIVAVTDVEYLWVKAAATCHNLMDFKLNHYGPVG